jgi:hypothetical protein
VSNNGLIGANAIAALAGNNTVTPLNNAGQVAWLLDHYAVAAESDKNKQMALQAAIWETINGYNTSHLDLTNNNSVVIADYKAIMENFNMGDVGNVSNYLWITPMDSNGNFYQAQVTAAPVPEPSAVMLFGAGVAGIVFLRRRAVK